jgi:transposase InsO family protein
MNQEYWKFWKKPVEERAGGNELERSESSFPPATPSAEEGPAESREESFVMPEGQVAERVDSSSKPNETPSVNDAAIVDIVSVGGGAEDDAPDAAFEEVSPAIDPELECEPSLQAEIDQAAAVVTDTVWDGDSAGVDSGNEEGDRELQEALDWGDSPLPPPNLRARKKGVLAKPRERPQPTLSPQQKLLLLDTWMRSGLPARDYGALVNVSRHTLYAWKRKFEQLGPAGLMEQPRGGPKGSKLPELTKRTILMLKQAHPDWGCQRISDIMLRGPALPASAATVSRVLHEAGYEVQETNTHPHAPPVHSFERAKPNQLWQTDLFTFMLKRQNRRVYLVAFMDDHSRFLTGYGLHATQSAALVIEVLRAALAAFGVPGEILTDNGSQYVTWRGKSQFSRELEKRGVKQIVARPRRPQTLGKIERFWGSLWRECLETSVFLDLADARQRIGLYIDYYNFQRPHQGIEGLVPADRFFSAAPEVLKTLKERVAANALELSRQGVPKKPFYLTGQLDGKPFSVHQEGDRVILRQADGPREEIDLQDPLSSRRRSPVSNMETLPPSVCPDGSPTTLWQVASGDAPLPGQSPVDELLRDDDLAARPRGSGGDL